MEIYLNNMKQNLQQIEKEAFIQSAQAVQDTEARMWSKDDLVELFVTLKAQCNGKDKKPLQEKKDGRVEQCFCQSYYDDSNVLQNCTCGKCGKLDRQPTPLERVKRRIEKMIQRRPFSQNDLCYNTGLSQALDIIDEELEGV
jgi:hypothetical protein